MCDHHLVVTRLVQEVAMICEHECSGSPQCVRTNRKCWAPFARLCGCQSVCADVSIKLYVAPFAGHAVCASDSSEFHVAPLPGMLVIC